METKRCTSGTKSTNQAPRSLLHSLHAHSHMGELEVADEAGGMRCIETLSPHLTNAIQPHLSPRKAQGCQPYQALQAFLRIIAVTSPSPTRHNHFTRCLTPARQISGQQGSPPSAWEAIGLGGQIQARPSCQMLDIPFPQLLIAISSFPTSTATPIPACATSIKSACHRRHVLARR